MFHLARQVCRCFVSGAAILSLLALAGGCTLWDNDRWDLDRYRDDRAVDIEQRLERNEPIVKSPF